MDVHTKKYNLIQKIKNCKTEEEVNRVIMGEAHVLMAANFAIAHERKEQIKEATQ